MTEKLSSKQKKQRILKQEPLNQQEIDRLESYPNARSLNLKDLIAANRQQAAVDAASAEK